MRVASDRAKYSVCFVFGKVRKHFQGHHGRSFSLFGVVATYLLWEMWGYYIRWVLICFGE